MTTLAGGFVLTLALLASANTAAAGISVRRGYVDDRFGQLHYVQATPDGRAIRHRPLVMIHQVVNSSIEARPLFTEMARDRIVIAMDTPGYGGSDGPDAVITIEEYAAAIAEGLRRMGYGASQPVDIIGFHTGSLIAAEIAIAAPRMVRRVALSGVYVVPEERWKKALASLPSYRTSAEFFAWFTDNLPRLQAIALDTGVPDEDWGRITVEMLRSRVKLEFAHTAAFTYAGRIRERLPKVVQPVLLLVLGDVLSQPTADSQPFFRDARLVTLPQYRDGAYYPDPAPVAAALRSFLDQDPPRR